MASEEFFVKTACLYQVLSGRLTGRQVTGSADKFHGYVPNTLTWLEANQAWLGCAH